MRKIKMYTVEEVAILFKVNKSDVIDWINTAEIKAIALPLYDDHYRITEQWLDDFIRFRKKCSESLTNHYQMHVLGVSEFEISYPLL